MAGVYSGQFRASGRVIHEPGRGLKPGSAPRPHCMERSSSRSVVETSREVPCEEHSASRPASPLVGAATSSACRQPEAGAGASAQSRGEMLHNAYWREQDTQPGPPGTALPAACSAGGRTASLWVRPSGGSRRTASAGTAWKRGSWVDGWERAGAGKLRGHTAHPISRRALPAAACLGQQHLHAGEHGGGSLAGWLLVVQQLQGRWWWAALGDGMHWVLQQ